MFSSIRGSKANLDAATEKAKALITEFSRADAQAGEEIVVSERLIKIEQDNIAVAKTTRERAGLAIGALRSLVGGKK